MSAAATGRPAARRAGLAAGLAALLLPLLAVPAALAEGLRTNGPAVLYAAPSEKGNPLLILEAGYPLRKVVGTDRWDKVETPGGKVGWVRSDTTDVAHLAVVRASGTNVHAAPSSGSDIVFAAERGVILEVVGDEEGGWIGVRHEDGESGHIPSRLVWRNHARLPAGQGGGGTP